MQNFCHNKNVQKAFLKSIIYNAWFQFVAQEIQRVEDDASCFNAIIFNLQVCYYRKCCRDGSQDAGKQSQLKFEKHETILQWNCQGRRWAVENVVFTLS